MIKLFSVFGLILIIFTQDSFEYSRNEELFQENDKETAHRKSFEKKNSDLIKNLLEHFKNPDSLNMPLPIPDPLVMPNRTYPLIVQVHTFNVTAYGVSRIRVENFTSDIVEMKMHFGLRMSRLTLIGNYSYHNIFLQHYFGGFNITVLNAHTDCNVKLQLTRLGGLEASDIKMDLISREKMYLNVENAGFVGFFVNKLGDSLFDTLRSYIFTLISVNIRNNMNEHLKMFKVTFPNSIPPFDLAVAELRKFVRASDLDPYLIPDYQYATNIYSVDITQIAVTGLSSFYRIGDINILMDNHIVHAEVNVGTEVLESTCKWEAGVAGLLTRSGEASFTIDYINMRISINQSLDLSKKPKLGDLNIKLGNIQLRMDGAGTFDYVAEFAVNLIPNLLRYQIVQAAEMPIRRRVQEIMDNTDIEQFILDKLPIIDEQLQKNNINFVIEDELVEEGLVIKGTDLDQELIV